MRWPHRSRQNPQQTSALFPPLPTHAELADVPTAPDLSERLRRLARPRRARARAPQVLRDPRGTTGWLRLTSSGWHTPQATIEQREAARRSRFASWVILGLLVGVAILSPLALDDVRARVTLAVWVVGLLGAAVLNRRGRVTQAGVVLVVLISGGILVANLANPLGLTLGELPTFDVYVVSLVLAATVLPRRSIFLVAGGNILLVVGTYLLLPHNADIAQDAARYSSVMMQTVSLLGRPIALQLVLAVVATLWVRGTEDEIRRADRAEEIAAWEARDRERTFALEEGVRYLHQTLAEWATGDVRGRIPAMPVAILEQVRQDLNAFIERFRPALQPSFQLYRLQQEAQRLTAALEDWVQGHPVVWPAPSGTPLDRAVVLLSQSRPPQLRLTHPPRPTPRLSRPTAPPSLQPFGPWPSSGPAPTMAETEQRPGQRTTGQPAAGRQTGAPRPIEPDLPDWLRPQPPSQPLPHPADSLASRDPLNPLDPLGPLLGQLPPESPPLG